MWAGFLTAWEKGSSALLMNLACVFGDESFDDLG